MKRADEDLPELTDAEWEEQEEWEEDAAALREYDDAPEPHYEVATGVESRGW